MDQQLKTFGLKLIGLIILTPLMGYGFLRCYEYSEKVWKTNNRKKRWLVMCGIFFLLACIGGWLR